MSSGSSWHGNAFSIVPLPLLSDARVSHVLVRVYAVLASHANARGECWPTLARLSELSGIRSEADISRYVARLVALGYVSRRPGGFNRPNVYTVHATAAGGAAPAPAPVDRQVSASEYLARKREERRAAYGERYRDDVELSDASLDELSSSVEFDRDAGAGVVYVLATREDDGRDVRVPLDELESDHAEYLDGGAHVYTLSTYARQGFPLR